MSERSFEQRTHEWLETGPTRLPPDALDNLMRAIAPIPQERLLTRFLPRPVASSGRRLLIAAVIVVAVAGGSLTFLRTVLPDVATRQTDDLLFDYPDATTVFERSGGPATKNEEISLGNLSPMRAFVLVASCTGGGTMTANVYYPGTVVAAPSVGGGEAPPEAERPALATLPVTCDGLRQHMNVGTMEMPSDVEVTASIVAGTTWRVAVGEYESVRSAPEFPLAVAPDGWYTLLDMPPTLMTSGTGMGIQTPQGSTSIAVAVQCKGDPITLFSDPAGDETLIECADPATVIRVEFPAVAPGFDVRARTDGVAWIHLTAEADGPMAGVRPSAPPLPVDIASRPFAESDGAYLAFGTLGSETQQTVRLQEGVIGIPGGDMVAVVVPADDGSRRIELWSMSEAAVVRVLATIPATVNYGPTWVDATHRAVYYVLFLPDFSSEWHRVGFDGTADTVVGRLPVGEVLTSGVLAVDDSIFVIDSCPAVGVCRRIVDDASTGRSRTIEIDGERTCELVGVVEGLVVARSAPTCGEPESGRMTVQDLDGGERRLLVDGRVRGAIVRGTDGPTLAYTIFGESRTTLHVVPLSGGDGREVVTFEHPEAPELPLSNVPMPPGDWVLLAGPLADTPSNRQVGRAMPRIVDLRTGEAIELINLPHTGS